VPASEIKREVLRDGAVQLTAGSCTFVYRRPRAGVLLVAISGNDRGEFGSATLDEISLALLRERPLELFVDAREAHGPAVSVSEEWTRFFSLNQSSLTRVSVLVGSKAVHLAIAIAQHLSRTGSLIQIYTDPEVFAARLAAASRERGSR
jgi:hypothetical protein